MDLEKLLEMQKTLDERIIKEKGLEGQDLFPNTVLALQVELAEFANEGRWFKHWSNDREPRTKEYCEKCKGEDWYHDDFLGNMLCKNHRNPLLEEFVDGVHFFLSIANQKGWQEALWVYEEQIYHDKFDGDLTAYYLEMVYFLNKAYMEKYPNEQRIAGFQKNKYFFRMAWILFLNLGINGFGLTPEQIEQAYFEKNAINHQRQEEGY